MRAGPGTAVLRNEDVPLLTGAARGVADALAGAEVIVGGRFVNRL